MTKSVSTREFLLKIASGTAPLVLLPMLVLLFESKCSPWVLMWGLSFALYAGLKWLSFYYCELDISHSLRRTILYLFLWPGMEPRSFLDVTNVPSHPEKNDLYIALRNIFWGLTLLLFVAPLYLKIAPYFSAWLVMIGFILSMHFGLFRLLSWYWQTHQINAELLMCEPFLATSLSDFWGNRWNRAFRDLSYNFLFRPTLKVWGSSGATLFVFFVSGLIHDFVISYPAEGGWGFPTVYFILQGGGLLLERSSFGKQIGLSKGWRGRLFCGVLLIAPLPWLFHSSFQEQVVLPMLNTIITIAGINLTDHLDLLIFIGGITHFGILTAGFLAPQVLDWKKEFEPLDPVTRHMIWLHGAFIVMTITAFGLVSVILPDELVAGTPLAKAICGFITFFWGTRLLAQFFVFDASQHLTNLFLKVGYHGLTVVFAYHTTVYACAALG